MPFYAVANGRVPGIYSTWEECCSQVHKFKSAKYKKFKTKEEAEQFILTNQSSKLNKNKSINTRSSLINNQSTLSLSRSTQFPSLTSIASTIRPSSVCSSDSILIEKIKKSKKRLNSIKRSMSSSIANGHQETIIIDSDDDKTPCKSKSTKQAILDSEDSIIIVDEISNQQQSSKQIPTKQLIKNFNQLKSNLNDETKNEIQSNQITNSNNITVRVSPRNCKSNRFNLPEFIPFNTNNHNNNAQHDENKSKNILQKRPKKGHVVVYTDGACSNNGYPNAKAGIGIWWGNDDPRNLSEPLEGHPTNNRAEICAAIKAIDKAAEEGYDSITICTDSDFLVKSAKEWVYKWQKNGWLLPGGKKVKNKDDFIKLLESMKKIKVLWDKVKAHIGIPGNEEADRLANEAIGVRKSSQRK